MRPQKNCFYPCDYSDWFSSSEVSEDSSCTSHSSVSSATLGETIGSSSTPKTIDSASEAIVFAPLSLGLGRRGFACKAPSAYSTT